MPKQEEEVSCKIYSLDDYRERKGLSTRSRTFIALLDRLISQEEKCEREKKQKKERDAANKRIVKQLKKKDS